MLILKGLRGKVGEMTRRAGKHTPLRIYSFLASCAKELSFKVHLTLHFFLTLIFHETTDENAKDGPYYDASKDNSTKPFMHCMWGHGHFSYSQGSGSSPAVFIDSYVGSLSIGIQQLSFKSSASTTSS